VHCYSLQVYDLVSSELEIAHKLTGHACMQYLRQEH
jgi:hypothetical protein